MQSARLDSIPEHEQRSPTGKFHSFSRNVSVALGAIRNAGTWAGSHPFDFQIRRIPPGAAVCPFHVHFAQWEAFLIRAGTATIRAGDETFSARAGDVFVHPPGEAHQLINSGRDDLEVFIFADNPPLDACYYPDSNKWGLRPPGRIFRIEDAHYFDGEDNLPAGAPPHAIAVAPPLPPVSPFAERIRNIEAIAWEEWRSPKGKFHGRSKELSIALGAKRNAPTGLGGHPFDLELGQLAPGECGCPFHSHAAQWEMLVFLAGTATVRAGSETRVFGAGEVVIHPPGEPHGFTNTGDSALVYLLVADNPPVDYWHYPDSNKWGVREPRMFFRPQPVEYYEDEE